jgi:serine/threonine protein kinase
MTAGPGEDRTPGDAAELSFHRVTGDPVRAKASFGPDVAGAPALLTARPVQLADGTGLYQVRVADTAQRTGYERLDNEILAGLWLREATAAVGYPPEVSRLYGYEATSAHPFALLEPYRGEPLTVAGHHLTDNEQHQFQVSLLTGLCWLAAAGIAHRGIAPSTVRWDGRHAQITDFSLCSVIGALREPIGALPWAAREQRQGHVRGRVSMRDDIWAAGRLIFYIHTQEELTDRSQVDGRPALKNLLDGVFGPPEDRPTARDLLTRLGEECPVPRSLPRHPELERGRRRFYTARSSKHPGAGSPASLNGDGSGESSDAAREPPARAGALAGAPQSPPQGGGMPRRSWGARRLMRRFPLLVLLIAGGLATLQAIIVTALVR